MTKPDSPPSLRDLEKLERTICRGLAAYDERNELIVALVHAGHRQADIARAINSIRKKVGAPPITPDAIAATIKRVEKKNSPE